MRASILVASAGLLAVGGWLMLRTSEEAAALEQEIEQGGAGLWTSTEEVLKEVGQSAVQVWDTITMSLNLNKMRTVTAADVLHPNVRALVAVIRRGEGTAGPEGYRTLFGGELFDSFAAHPNRKITRTLGGRSITSTAAGAGQFLYSTWQETARIMGLTDFTPASQDRAIVGRIAARGALEDAKAGRFDVAVKKIATEWASMPGSPYGQPVISLATARAVFASAGGSIA
ncbi:glycoside hydrolase family 24 protein [Hydrogenophaga sp.]|uniref:glycoside hydrolase family 24 protein n=1 Tax=Hydrogenophaga sp. TaxID=1904254 RepID=UPI003D146BB1